MELSTSSTNPKEALLLKAAQDGDEETVRSLLEADDKLVWSKARNTGNSPLHLAVSNNHEAIVRLLLERGVNPEVTNIQGWKPLAIAARNGPSLLPTVELLLQYGADVGSINRRLNESALHVCAETGFCEMARILLDHGAQVDFRDLRGRTPLFKAVSGRRIDMIKLLLEYGAAKDIQTDQGVTLESLAANDPNILQILRTPQLLHGPRISGQGQPTRSGTSRTLIARLAPPFDDNTKMMACHAFKATVVDFYLGEREQRIQKTVPIYEVIYGQGANSLMNAARDGQIQDKPSFRWYHLPANNMDWVEVP
ncbi:ankyrin repeat-containing domain protein [Thelonectria olida]|uniref:Ankyrin repeat-containing domain protein n=1 Tax=Thelonectria olida TaxID=1576542 RepID=A0A9P9AP45_9HYPO|nr:ankyrin repeat-containing domain protein [Thelonectria olida]